MAHAATFTGRVFEDVNYGGGVGRSFAASGGTGVPGATVELYRVTGNTYVTNAVTDLNGNYSLSSGSLTGSEGRSREGSPFLWKTGIRPAAIGVYPPAD